MRSIFSVVFLLYIYLVFVDGVYTGLFKRKQQLLSIDGAWSGWNDWTPCYQNTADVTNFYSPWQNFFVQSRNRTCTEPKPLHGGDDCAPPSHRFRQCSCSNPLLGVSKYQLKENKIFSSRYLAGHPPEQVRVGQNFSGWCSKSELSYIRKTYIQVEFGKFVTAGAIVTYGIKNGRIKGYKLKHSLNGKKWEILYPDKKRTNEIFKGNIVPRKMHKNIFPDYTLMKYLRFVPTETFRHPCLKMELYGCSFTCGKPVNIFTW